MRLAWPIEINLPGIAYGYSMFNQCLKSEVEVLGIPIHDDAPIGIYVGPADLFDPQYPVNVLCTMYETETIPPTWVERCNRADLVLVPCKHNRDSFKRSGVRVPIKTMAQGLYPEQWPTRERTLDGPLTVLFVGWPNQRKGMDTLAQAFLLAFQDDPNTRLYLKTSQASSRDLRHYTLGGVNRLTIDDRELTHADMVNLYHRAHVFVLPSRGEGWGRPAMEAMATGCPVVATGYSGLTEFVTPQTGWPIRFGWCDVDYGHPTRAAEPDVQHLIDILAHIKANYAHAAEKAYRAAEFVKTTFTWGHTAERLLEAVAPLERIAYERSGAWQRSDDVAGSEMGSPAIIPVLAAI